MDVEMSEALHLLIKDKLPKNSTLKSDAEEALKKIQAYDKEKNSFSVYARETPSIVIPFVKAMQELSHKHRGFLPCILLIHKMVTRDIITPEFVPHILEGFKRSTESFPEVRLRILQMILPFAQNPLLVRGPNLLSLFKIGVLLVETSDSQAAGTSKVVVCHLVSSVFERPSTLDSSDKAAAIKDCGDILLMAMESSRKNSLFGLDLLAACMVEEGTLFYDPVLAGPLEECISLLVERLEMGKIPILARVLAILLRIITHIVKEESKIICILLSIFRAHMDGPPSILRAEFLYLLPYPIVYLAAMGSAELSDAFFTISDEVSINQIAPIKSLSLENLDKLELSDDPAYTKSLHISKLIKISLDIEKGSEKFLLEVFLPYFLSALKNIQCSLATPINDVSMETFQNSVFSLANVLVSSKSGINQLLLEIYQMAQKNPLQFYFIAATITFDHVEHVEVWSELFSLASATETTHLELEAWMGVINQLIALPKPILSKALRGACAAPSVSPQRLASLFLLLVHHSESLLEEFSLLIKRVFSEQALIEAPEASAELVSSFLGAYFATKASESIHRIVISHIRQVFTSLHTTDQTPLVTRQILMSLSLGVRVNGESLKESWCDIYGILLAAVESEELYGTVFDILQIVTDRMLSFLPANCLISTAKLLCTFCTGNKEDNLSLRALFCIRELTEYVITQNISSDIRKSVWNVCVCLLCTMAYDPRDDIRDSAIVQVFESIYFYREKRTLDWRPLVQIFLKKLLSAAVYAKDKEIYSGDYDECSGDSASYEDNVVVESECFCNSIGGCATSTYSSAAKESYERSLESAKSIILAVSSLIFECFGELQSIPGFFNLWSLLGKIFIRFSKDSEMKGAVLYALRASLSKTTGIKYLRSIFSTVSDICQVPNQTSGFSETLIQILRQSYRAILPSAKKKETAQFFAGITSLLSYNTLVKQNRFTFIEFEAISALTSEGSSCSCEVQVYTLLKWLRFSQSAPSSTSSCFIEHCMTCLSQALMHMQYLPEVHKEVALILISYQRTKRKYPQCWASALHTLQRIIILETKKSEETSLIWISRDLFGLPSENDCDKAEDPKSFINRNVLQAIAEDRNYVQVVKEEEKEMQRHLEFLEGLLRSLKGPLLLRVCHLIIEVWSSALPNNLPQLYISATKALCNALGTRKELQNLSNTWIFSVLSEYNIEIRQKRTAYSHFQREAVAYILQKIQKKEIRITNRDFSKELALAISTPDSFISKQALNILQNQEVPHEK